MGPVHSDVSWRTSGALFLCGTFRWGAFSSLAAAFLTRRMSHPLLAPLPPEVIVERSRGVAYVAPLSGCPTLSLSYISPQARELRVTGLGYPLLTHILRLAGSARCWEESKGRTGDRVIEPPSVDYRVYFGSLVLFHSDCRVIGHADY